MIDIFELRTMLAVVMQLKRPGTFLRSMFFKGFNQADTQTVDVDIFKGKRRLAPFVSPLSPGKEVERLGYSTSTIKPGYVKPKMATTAEQLMKRLPGEVLYAGNMTPMQRAAAQLARDLGDLYDQITRVEEWMCAQALNTGQIVMKIIGEDGTQTVTVDFSMASSHKITLTGTDLWSDQTNSDPLGDLTTWSRLTRQDSGQSATDVIFGSDAGEAFIKHPKVLSELDNRRANTGQINPKQLPQGVSWLGTINRPGLFVDAYTYDEWFVDPETGTEGPAIPTNKVIMGSQRTQNSRLYGAIMDLEAIQGGMVAANRFPKTWVTKDPSVRWLMVQAAPLMALNQPDAFISAQVLA